MGQDTYEKVEISGNARAVLGDVLAPIINLFIGGMVPSEEATQLALRASPNFKNLLLLRAAEQGDVDQVQQLLVQGADVEFVENEGQTALHKAVIGRHVNIIHELLSCPIRRHFLLNHHEAQWADTPLHRAAVDGDIEVVEALLQYDPPLEAKQVNKATPLLLACRFGKPKVVSILLEKGANPLARNHAGSIPLHIAANHGHLPVLEVLLSVKEAKNWLEMRNDFDDTPLFIAVVNGKERCARRLWQAGADLHILNFHSANLLHASVHGNLHYFLADILPHFNQAELNHKNVFCHTPYQLSMWSAKPLSAKILQRRIQGLS